MTRATFLLGARLAIAAAICWIICAGIFEVRAQDATLTWSDDCENTVYFDPSKYDETAVRNTVHLLFGPADFQTPMVVFPIKMRDVAKLLDGLNQECSTVLGAAKSLKFLPLRGIEDYRQMRISEIEDWCKYEDAKLRGLHDPAVLREYTRAPKVCSPLVDAMEGKTDLAVAFGDTVKETCKDHVAPATCIKQRFAEAQQEGGNDGMRLFLTTYAWSNCVVRQTLQNTNTASMAKRSKALEKQFRRTFKLIQSNCEPPEARD
jgi:hypothetical protein